MEFEKIQTIIADVLSIHNPEEITMDKSFKDDLGADSLDSVEIVMRLEEAFDIEIPDDAVENIETVGDVVEAIQKVKGLNPDSGFASEQASLPDVQTLDGFYPSVFL